MLKRLRRSMRSWQTQPRYLLAWVIVKMVFVIVLLLVTGGAEEHDVGVVYRGF